jgi:hypothetical protein
MAKKGFSSAKVVGHLELMVQVMRAMTEKRISNQILLYLKIALNFDRDHQDESLASPFLAAASMATHLQRLDLIRHVAAGAFMVAILDCTSGYASQLVRDQLELPEEVGRRLNGFKSIGTFQDGRANLGFSLVHLLAVTETNNHSFQGNLLFSVPLT